MQTEIEKIILEAVGEDKEMPRNDYGIPYDSSEKGYNQALSDLRTKAPEIAKKIVELVKLDHKHELDKFLDGFGHPKECEECKLLGNE